MACAPGYVSLLKKNESSETLPSKIDNGNRFADPNLTEQEKPTDLDPSIDEKLIDRTQFNSGSPEDRLAQLNKRLLNNAEFVVTKEKNKPKIGDACNYFIQRILQLSGFSDEGFKAGAFDEYANRHFTGYKTAVFAVEPLRKDAKALENYLNSFPESTPFILQWQRKVGIGHIALVTRKKDKLIIYEASLGRFNAEKKLTNARTILSASDRYKLTVFVNFMPSDK